MKKRNIFTLIAIIAISLLSFNAKAQNSDALLDKIEQANGKLQSRSGDFCEIRQWANKQPKTFEGKIQYNTNSDLTMNYTDSTEYFCISDNTMSMKRNGKSKKFDLNKNKPMKTLSQMLLSSFNGELRDLAASVGSTLNVEETKDAVIATLKAKKKAVKGYSKVILEYDSKTYHLFNMVLEEFDGSVTTYTIK